jgi:hypothetical protein
MDAERVMEQQLIGLIDYVFDYRCFTVSRIFSHLGFFAVFSLYCISINSPEGNYKESEAVTVQCTLN